MKNSYLTRNTNVIKAILSLIKKESKQMPRDFIDDIIEAVRDVKNSTEKEDLAVKAAVSTAAGGAVGSAAIAATGLTAAGMVGGGAGIGCAAGPVGFAVGALVGLSAYGVKRMLA
jgi:phage-related tail protein